MRVYSLNGLICALLLLTIYVPESNAWTWWNAQTLNINSDRAIYINNGCSAEQQTRINNSCKAWFWTGAKYRPYIVSTTTRSAGVMDKINVIGNNTNQNNTWLGRASFWDNSADEVDIQMNTGRFAWHTGTHWTMPLTPTQYSYQATATHEIGHLMGLWHSSENPSETNTLLSNATMYYTSGTCQYQ